MIELETLLKRLGRWDNETYQSTDITLCESMFLDSVITRIFDIHIKELGLKFGLSETRSSDFKDLETGSQLLLPIALQVQWLTTRLRFWDSEPTFEMVDAFGNIYSRRHEWRRIKAKLEYLLFSSYGTKDSSSIVGFREKTRSDIQHLAELTISLASSLLKVAGPSYIKECRLRFGNLNLLLFQATDSGAILCSTHSDIMEAISELFEQNFFNHSRKQNFFNRSRKKSVFPGYRRLDNGAYEFTDWDWSELETTFEPLEPFHSSETQDLREACLSRISLYNLQPQGREWELVTLL